MSEIPRVLVFGQAFNEQSGGGITISNLFKDWPREKLASSFVAWNYVRLSTTVCTNTYIIGRLEHKWKFPLSLVKKQFPESGCIQDKGDDQIIRNIRKNGFRNILSSFLNPFIHWLGVYHIASKIYLSEAQKSWIREFNPELLYLQVSTLEGIMFAIQLIDFCSVPTVIHMMDDWPSTISMNGPLRKFWKRRIDYYFKILLEKTDRFLSISEFMSAEYAKRYNKNFTPFHNPVDLSSFNTIFRGGVEHDKLFRVLYIGRIGTANRNSIIFFAKVVSQMNSKLCQIEFHIFSKDFDTADLRQIKSFPAVNVYPPVSHESVPTLLSQYNLLLLPLDFTEDGLKFARLSIPTKATEYMLSGTPILVFAPEETAVSRFFKDNDCGFCLTQNNPGEIRNTLEFLISNPNFTKRMSRNAAKVAREQFDADKVRQRFRETLTSVASKGQK